MTTHNKLSREAREKERETVLFLLYENFGPGRSLEKLRDICATIGLKLHLNTYKNYSAKYEWQRKLLERQVTLREEREKEALTAVDKMNESHLQVSRGLMALAIAGINYYQNRLERNRAAGLPQTLNFNVRDIVRLVRQAQLGERLARGETTNRTEIITEVIGTFVHEFALIFKAVNKITDEDEREREYVRLFDEMLYKFYRETIDSGIKQIKDDIQYGTRRLETA